MAFFRKKPVPPARPPERPAAQPARDVPVSAASSPSARRHTGVIVAPHLTEKTNQAAARRWYAFRVRADASKIAIKGAVEERFGVSVERVRTITRGPKSVRIGRIVGKTPGFKKALVRVRPGQTLDLA